MGSPLPFVHSRRAQRTNYFFFHTPVPSDVDTWTAGTEDCDAPPYTKSTVPPILRKLTEELSIFQQNCGDPEAYWNGSYGNHVGKATGSGFYWALAPDAFTSFATNNPDTFCIQDEYGQVYTASEFLDYIDKCYSPYLLNAIGTEFS